MLRLYDDDHMLHHVGLAAAFTATVRKQLVVELTPLRADALETIHAGLGRGTGGSQRERTAAARCNQPVDPRERSELGAAPAGARL